MSEQPLSYVLEAVLLAAGRPVSVDQMLELFEESQRPSVEDVNAALEELARMAILTLGLDPGAAPLPEHVLRKHWERKHGPNAYYGQR